MSGCRSAFELSRFADGDLGGDERRGVEAHLSSCARCRFTVEELRAITSALACDPIVEHVDLAPLVLRRAALPPRRRSFLGPATAALAACAALVTGIAVERHRASRGAVQMIDSGKTSGAVAAIEPAAAESGFQARGGADSPDRWVAIHAFSVETGPSGEVTKPVLPLASLATCPTRLLFAYDNGGPHPFRRLAIVAKDDHGGIHWLFPEHGDGGTIAAEAGTGRELHEEVTLPEGGPRGERFRIFGLFTDEPRTQGAIEDALGVGWEMERLPLARTGQHRLELRLPGCASR